MGRSSGQGPGAKSHQGGWGVLAPVTQALSFSEGFLAAPGESHLLGGVWAQQGGCWSWQEAQLWPELALHQS